MTDKIYVVMGETGYSKEDYTYTAWLVIAYFNEQAAQEHAAKAEARAKEIYPRWERLGDGSFVHSLSGVNEYDPNMEKDGATTYTVHPVDIADSYAGTNQPNEGNRGESREVSGL